MKLKTELNNIMDGDEDSVIIYMFRSKQYTGRQEMGLKKGGEEFLL
ncbi:hypothetical protein B4167_3201 [Caldibacillus thermoamylovorans]|uniref:Uncharacterized protein n=1 Tax=Caldibacillus thermoamylovorans TaxID=35841 RepID=A0ABD4A604_9BACI|nr:hypothetical protein B4167_3201 [Caldibacillus thermoamylovorans]